MAETSKTTDQALTVLLTLVERGPMTPAELSRTLGLNRTVVHRLLATLHGRAFVVRQDDGYVPGPMLIRVAAHVRPELSVAAHGVMVRLADVVGETVVLHVRDGDRALVLDQVVATQHVVRVEHQIGSHHNLEIGASGRTLLAFADEGTIERALRRSEQPDWLRNELEVVRQIGYCVSNDELQSGVHGLAVPVRDAGDTVVAALAVLVPITRAGRPTDSLSLLEAAARELSGPVAGDRPQHEVAG